MTQQERYNTCNRIIELITKLDTNSGDIFRHNQDIGISTLHDVVDTSLRFHTDQCTMTRVMSLKGYLLKSSDTTLKNLLNKLEKVYSFTSKSLMLNDTKLSWLFVYSNNIKIILKETNHDVSIPNLLSFIQVDFSTLKYEHNNIKKIDLRNIKQTFLKCEDTANIIDAIIYFRQTDTTKYTILFSLKDLTELENYIISSGLQYYDYNALAQIMMQHATELGIYGNMKFTLIALSDELYRKWMHHENISKKQNKDLMEVIKYLQTYNKTNKA